ncbi:MAG: nucleotide sugar dehydrogenase [Deltaproteobacteria bacterium]
MKKNRTISIVGLGYVGLPVAVAFGTKCKCIGFDINKQRLAELTAGYDKNGEVTAEELANAEIVFTDKTDDIKRADFHIVAVPTPIDSARRPNLKAILKASELVGTALKRGDIVVYESTVYPGLTEDECVPVLERASGLVSGKDFTVGYSPERINPGDKEHTFTKIKKIVAGQDSTTLDIIASVYESVVTAGVYRASSIKVAEAAKVIENTQRDLNIALINELAIIFDRLGIDTNEVLEAAGTKWNFLPFKPGLVGGHCIGVDPYYLTYKAEQIGYNPQVILAGRRINDGMGSYIAQQTVKKIIQSGDVVKGAKVIVLGFTFKENCPDIRNSKVVDVVKELQEFGCEVSVHDPLAECEEVLSEYEIKLTNWNDLPENADAVILAVSHREYVSKPLEELLSKLKTGGIFVDIKSVCSVDAICAMGINLWRL